MANKREFKKYVDALGASVIDEMVTSFYNVKGANRDEISKAIEATLAAIGKAKNNANVYFDKGVKAFGSVEEYSKAKKDFFVKLFDKIESDFNDDINAALKIFNAALPEDEKARNKEVASEAK